MCKTATITIEMPECCGECYLFRYHADTMPLGNFTYQHLFRCKLEPEDLSEDKGDVVYVNDFMRHGKPVWCPLKEDWEE